MKNRFAKQTQLKFAHRINMSIISLVLICSAITLIPQPGNTGWSVINSIFRRFLPEGTSGARIAQVKRSVVEPRFVRSMSHIPTLRGGDTRMLRNPEIFDNITARAAANQYTNIHWPTLATPFRRLKQILNADSNRITFITGPTGVGKKTLVEIFTNSTVMNLEELRTLGNDFVLPNGLEKSLVLRFDIDHYLSSAIPRDQREMFLDGLIENLRIAQEAGHRIIIDIDGFEKLKPSSTNSNREQSPGAIFLGALQRMTDHAQVIARTDDASIIDEIELQRMDGVAQVDVPVPDVNSAPMILMQHIEHLQTRYGVDIPQSLADDAARIVKNGYTPNGTNRVIHPPGAGIRLLEDAVNKLQTKRAAGRPQALIDVEDKITNIIEKGRQLNQRLARRADDFDPERIEFNQDAYNRLDVENFDETALPDDMPFLRKERLEIQSQFEKLQAERAQIEEQIEEIAQAETQLMQKRQFMEEIEEALRMAGDNIDEQARIFDSVAEAIDAPRLVDYFTNIYRSEIEQVTRVMEQAREAGNTRMMRSLQLRIEKTEALITEIEEMNPAELLRLSNNTAETAHTSNLRSIGALNEIDFDLLVETAAEAQFGEATDIAIGRIRAQIRGDMRVFERISQDLSNWIVGQAPILKDIARILKVKMTDTGQGLKGIFFLFGESRLGKTEIGRALQKIVGGNQMMLVEGGQHADAHSRAALIGAPPGYVGYKEGGGGRMTKFAQSSPNGVLMLDEIEKMDPEILDILLTVLETGVWRDMASGVEYGVNWTVIVSANLLRDVAERQPELFERLIHLQNTNRIKESGSIINDQLLAADSGLANVAKRPGERVLRPELLNRADGIYLVQEFINPEMSELVRRMFKGKHIRDYAEQLIGVVVRQEVYDLLGGQAARAGGGEVMRSARNVPHRISQFLKEPIDGMRSARYLQEGDIVNIRLKNASEMPEEGIRIIINPDYLTGGAANFNANHPLLKTAEDGSKYIDYHPDAVVSLPFRNDEGVTEMREVNVADFLFREDVMAEYNWHVAAENIGDLIQYDVLDPNISNDALRALSESDELTNIADEAADAGEVAETLDASRIGSDDAAGLTVDGAAAN